MNFRLREHSKIYSFSIKNLKDRFSFSSHLQIFMRLQISAMLREASHLLTRSITSTSSKSVTARAFSTELPSTIDSTFVESWKKFAPNVDLPRNSFFLHETLSINYIFDSNKDHANFVLLYTSELSGIEVSFPFYFLGFDPSF